MVRDVTCNAIKQKFGIDWNDGTRMPIELPDFGRNQLADFISELKFLQIVELGVRTGEYSEILVKANPLAKVWGVDPYVPYRGYQDHTRRSTFDKFYLEMMTRMSVYPNYEILKEFSMDAVGGFEDESLDFVYVDANHELLACLEDIKMWMPKLRSGGIMAGHDYTRHRGPAKMHVVQAIHAYTDAYRVSPWFILGSKAMHENVVRDEARSWMLVK